MIKISIHRQPDNETCGPTSLHAVYRYYGDCISLDRVINTVKRVKTGGTLVPDLGAHALRRGYNATIYVYNVTLFDPSWFTFELSSTEIISKLEAQVRVKRSTRFLEATKAYVNFLELGGQLRFKELSTTFLADLFRQNLPVLTGLSSTYLYRCPREYENREGEIYYDDVRGEPAGHFVVLCGYDQFKRHVVVADPHRENPISKTNLYKVSSTRLINAIMLGVLTYDANLLIVSPKIV